MKPDKFFKLALIISTILLAQFLNIQMTAKENCIICDDLTFKHESYVIEDFPYVGQTTDFYCMFTTVTMALNYHGINISLLETLFNSGVGYSMLYSHPLLKHCLIGGNGASNWKADREFLASLYGFSYSENWPMKKNISEDKLWDVFWYNVKENITQDKPVITVTNPRSLTSVKNAVKKRLDIPEIIWNKIPEYVWDMFPSIAVHSFIIIGFNESNQTLCYNDPATALLGYPECGHYAWMNIKDFKESLNLLSKKYQMTYIIQIFENTSNEPLNEDMMFRKVHERNLELIKGNSSVYDDALSNKSEKKFFGIDAVKQFKNDLGIGFNNRIKTILTYKKMCTNLHFPISYIFYRLFDIFLPSFLNMTDFQTMANYFYRIAIEKRDMSDYLFEKECQFDDENLSNICRHDANILKHEAENFTKLAEEFTTFLKKGFFISIPRAILVTNEMSAIANKIIDLEERIIDRNM